MIKSKKCVQKRQEFIQLAINSPRQAAARLKTLALRLENSRNTTERTELLSEILHLSETTIYRDLVQD